MINGSSRSARASWISVVAVPVVLVVLAGCSSSGGARPSSSNAQSASTPSSTSSTTSSMPTSKPGTPTSAPVEDPSARAAVAAYQAFTRARYIAERTPSRVSKELARYAIDPALGSAQSLLTEFQLSNLVWRGTPPVTRLRVRSKDLSASPYPKITIIDCPTVSTTWRPYNTKTGAPATLVKPRAPAPWATTAAIVRYHNAWVVMTAKTDTGRTCAP